MAIVFHHEGMWGYLPLPASWKRYQSPIIWPTDMLRLTMVGSFDCQKSQIFCLEALVIGVDSRSTFFSQEFINKCWKSMAKSHEDPQESTPMSEHYFTMILSGQASNLCLMTMSHHTGLHPMNWSRSSNAGLMALTAFGPMILKHRCCLHSFNAWDIS